MELDDPLLAEVVSQAREAIDEADVIVFLLDAQVGPTGADLDVAELLRRTSKPVVLAANKVENQRTELLSSEFFEFGLGDPLPISAIQGQGTGDLLDAIVGSLPPLAEERERSAPKSRLPSSADPTSASRRCSTPSPGTSFDRRRSPGTTRDPIDTLVQHDDQTVLLIDTAGIRRRGRSSGAWSGLACCGRSARSNDPTWPRWSSTRSRASPPRTPTSPATPMMPPAA